MKLGFFSLSLAGLLLLGTSAWAAVEIVDDGTNTVTGRNNLNLGRAAFGIGGTGAMTLSFVSSPIPDAFDTQTKTIQLDYNAEAMGSYAFFVEPLGENGGNVDLSAFKYLSFWVRGAVGGEGFQVGLNNQANSAAARVQVLQYLPNGITTQWQKVVIPFSVLSPTILFNGATVSKIEFAVVNNFDASPDDNDRLVGAPSGTVYIANIIFGSSAPAPVWVSNYDHTLFPDGTTLNAARGSIQRYSSEGNPAYSSVTFTSAPYSLFYNFGTGENFTVHRLYRNGTPAPVTNTTDVSGCTHVQFDIRGVTGNETPSVVLQDINSVGNSIALGTIGTLFHTAQIPLSAFNTGGQDLTNARELDFDDTALPAGSVYLDNVLFVDTSTVAAPSAMSFNAVNITSGFNIGDSATSGTLGATAPSITSDSKMERVRFEYSADSGVTWNEIADDFATSDVKTAYSVTWNFFSLTNGNYQVRATSYHVGGTFASLAFPVVLALTPTVSPTPTISATLTPSASITATPSISATLTPSASITATPSISATLTASASITATPSISATLTASASITATSSISATLTQSATYTPTPTASPSPSISPTVPAASSTFTPTSTVTPTPTIALTATSTVTPSITLTPVSQELRVGRNSFDPAIGEVLPLVAGVARQGKVHIVIYSRLGDKIIDLFNQDAGPGVVALSWDGKNSGGHNVASGVYVIYAELGDQKSKHLVAVIR